MISADRSTYSTHQCFFFLNILFVGQSLCLVFLFLSGITFFSFIMSFVQDFILSNVCPQQIYFQKSFIRTFLILDKLFSKLVYYCVPLRYTLIKSFYFYAFTLYAKLNLDHFLKVVRLLYMPVCTACVDPQELQGYFHHFLSSLFSFLN